jgi:lycopene cyclase domain-containing protein
MEHSQYLLLMGGCLLITLPLELLLGARVYRRPRRLWLALWPMLVVFIAWDLVVIARHHWEFSARYTTGFVLPGGIPVEEVVFFVVIPICGLLTLDTVRHLLGRDR